MNGLDLGVLTSVVLLGLGTFALKATGPVVAGGRRLPAALESTATLLPAALLAALLVTQTIGGSGVLVLDARVAGLAAAALALRLRAPFVVVVLTASVVTALVRLIGACPRRPALPYEAPEER
jgi:branched-subunit amino acid transport protein